MEILDDRDSVVTSFVSCHDLGPTYVLCFLSFLTNGVLSTPQVMAHVLVTVADLLATRLVPPASRDVRRRQQKSQPGGDVEIRREVVLPGGVNPPRSGL